MSTLSKFPDFSSFLPEESTECNERIQKYARNLRYENILYFLANFALFLGNCDLKPTISPYSISKHFIDAHLGAFRVGKKSLNSKNPHGKLKILTLFTF